MKLTSYGAAQEVTGSCHLLEVGDRKVLLDCGLIQGRSKDELRNHDGFPFDASTIDAVVLSHAHIDHSGRLPLLYKKGFRGKIFCTPPTESLCQILLMDSAHIQEESAKFKSKKNKKAGLDKIEAFYTKEDAENKINERLSNFLTETFNCFLII